MQAIGSRPKIQVSADGSGVVGHAGARLLADLADATGLTAAYSTALRPLRPRGTGHDPGRIATDLAVMPADGGEAIADPGRTARTGNSLRPCRLDTDGLAAARRRRRDRACLAGFCPRPGPGGRLAAGRRVPTYEGGFGFHPLLCFLANTGEALPGRLRPGKAGANTASDHITVLDQALAQIPDGHRHGTDLLVRTGSAGSAKAFLAHVRDVRKRGIRTFFSVGYAITRCPGHA